VGTLRLGGAGWNSSFLRITASRQECTSETLEPEPLSTWSLVHPGEELSSPMLTSGVVAWITLPRGVRLFDPLSWGSMHSIPLLDRATSVAVSLNRNLVAQIEDSLQIFSLDVLKDREVHNGIRTSHVYPLGRSHIVCLLQPDRHLTILELETLRKLHPNQYTSLLISLLTNQPPPARASFSRGLVAEFGLSVVVQAWRRGTPLPKWVEIADGDPPLSGLSPDCTRIVTFYDSPRWELRVKDAIDGMILANLPLGDDGLEMGRVYDVIFDSETRFHLRVDGPAGHVPDSLRHTPIAVRASFAHDNQGGTGGFVGTSGNTAIHSRCELRMGHRRRVQEDLLDLASECTEGQRWTLLGWSVAHHGWG
jgi:hypothetical protein